MAYEKITYGKLSAVGTQVSDVTLPVGGQSLTGTASTGPSLFAGERLYENSALWFDTTANGHNDGVWTVTVHGNILGTSMPLARRAIGNGIDGMTTIPNLCATAALPAPQYVEWEQSSGNGISGSVYMMAKVNRGIVKGQFTKQGTDKVIEACIFATGASAIVPGNGIDVTSSNYLTNGVSNDVTITLVAGKSMIPTSAAVDGNAAYTGNSTYATLGGLQQMEFWDHCNYYVNATGFSGTWLVSVKAQIQGVTVVVANGSVAKTTSGATRIPLTSLFNGPSPRPTQITLDNVPGSGASNYFSGNIYVIAKASRGLKHKV